MSEYSTRAMTVPLGRWLLSGISTPRTAAPVRVTVSVRLESSYPVTKP